MRFMTNLARAIEIQNENWVTRHISEINFFFFFFFQN